MTKTEIAKTFPIENIVEIQWENILQGHSTPYQFLRELKKMLFLIKVSERVLFLEMDVRDKKKTFDALERLERLRQEIEDLTNWVEVEDTD